MTGRDVLAQLRLDDETLWIDRATDDQFRDATEALDGDRPLNFTTRARGGSKTTDASAVSLAWLATAEPGAKFYAAAAGRDQARLLADAVAGFARRTPSIGRGMKIDSNRITAIETGATLEVLSAELSMSWGIRPSGIVIDELAWWVDSPQSRAFLDSLLSSAAKDPDCRVLVITSPSSPTHFAHRLRDHAASDPLWRLSEQTGPPPWMDEARIEEQRRRLTDPMFQRLFEGRWVEGDEQLAVGGDVDAAITHEGPLEYDRRFDYAVGVDLGVRNDRTAAIISHRDEERVIVDRIAVWRGSRLKPVSLDAVEQWIKQAASAYGNAEVVIDPWQAIAMAERLRGAGVRVSEFSFSQQSVGRLAAVMVDLLRNRRLAIPDDKDYVEELRAVKLIEKSPGVFRLDHDRGKHDDQVIATALASQHLLKTAQRGAPVVIGEADSPWGHPGRRRDKQPPKPWKLTPEVEAWWNNLPDPRPS